MKVNMYKRTRQCWVKLNLDWTIGLFTQLRINNKTLGNIMILDYCVMVRL